MTRKRRDPRAELLALTVSEQPRRASPGSRPGTGRAAPPRSPGGARRGRRPGRSPPSLRLSGAALAHPGQQGRLQTAAAAGPSVRIIDDPAFLVLVVLDQPDGQMTDHDRQVIAAGRILADAGEGRWRRSPPASTGVRPGCRRYRSGYEG